MIIGYKKDLDGVLKAAIALRRYPEATMVCGDDDRDLGQKLAGYHGEVVLGVDEIVRQVPFRLKAGLREKFPSCSPLQRGLSPGSFIFYALRSRQCVPDELVRLVARHYPDVMAILSQKDAMAKKYYRLHREAAGELAMLKAYCRFRPSGDALYVEVSPKNRVEDLFLEWAMRRNGDRIVVVRCHADYYVLNARALGYRAAIAAVTREAAERLLGDMPGTDDGIWDTFYDSQNVESRRNKRYAKSRLPEKYSHISPEIRKERKKIEHGIQPEKLDDFFPG